MTAITTIPPPCCLATLPTEIAELVLENLNQPSLAACAIVNKAWHTLCAPFLLRTYPWRTVDINTPQTLDSFMSVESQRALYRNAAHIHSLYLCYRSAYNIFSPVDHGHTPQCTNLHSLQIDLYKDPVRNRMGSGWNYHKRHSGRPLDPASEIAVAALIRRNPGLKKLTVSKYMSPQTLVPLLTHDLPNLQVLVLDTYYCRYNQCITKVLLENLPESIRSVTLAGGPGNPVRRAAAAGALRKQLGWKKNETPPRQHHALESLTLNLWHFSQYSPVLVPFLNSCSSKLRTIHIPKLEWFRERQVEEALTRLGYALTELTDSDVPGHDSRTDALFVEYVSLSNQWKTIRFQHHLGAVGPMTIQAISERCKHLQYLNIARCRNVSSADLLAILAKAPCLKTFVALSCTVPMHRDEPFLFAQDFIALDWGSLVLEDFHCRIVVSGSDRHWDNDSHEAEERSSVHDVVVASRVLQRQVYRKLAEQRSLESLFLGQYLTTPMSQVERWYQSCCLEMTLKSGLDELADLRQLEELNVRSMGLRTGVPELEWMVAHWPNMRNVVGLFDTLDQDPLPGVCEWVRDNKIDWLSINERAWLRSRLQ